MIEVKELKLNVIREAEYVYIIHKPEIILFKARYRFKTLNKPFPKLNTSIMHTYSGGDVKSIGYRDSDGRSSEKGGKPITDSSGREISFECFGVPSKTERMTRFGFSNLPTDLKENDIYWIEISGEMSELVKKEDDRYKLPIVFTNEEKDSVVFEIKIPSKPEGIFKHHLTKIESVTPAPTFVYDEVDYKVFQWNLGQRSRGERDRFDVAYSLECTYNPLIKQCVSGIMGGVIGVIIGMIVLYLIGLLGR